MISAGWIPVGHQGMRFKTIGQISKFPQLTDKLQVTTKINVKVNLKNIAIVITSNSIFFIVKSAMGFNSNASYLIPGSEYDSKTAVVNANNAWTNLSIVEKEQYKEKALLVEPSKFEELSKEGQLKMINETRRKIEKLVCIISYC